MDPSRLPAVARDDQSAFAAHYAPIIAVDDKEPFSLIAAGYTVFESEGESPSFLPKRRVEWRESGYPAISAVEYALWWDWDIGHLYELEHVWAFVGSSGEVVAVEASWHGMYGPAELSGKPPVDGTHPVLLAQAGKHAMAATLEPFMEIREWAEQEAGPEAGKGGVLENEMFSGRLGKTPENDARVREYLRKLAFCPSWNFGRHMHVTTEMLVPWDVLAEWIPSRVRWWLDKI